MTDSSILHGAARIVKAGFTKDAYARLPDGNVASPSNPDANCFCLVGAIIRASGNESVAAADVIVDKWVVPLIPPKTIHLNTYPGSARGWNDAWDRTQDQVVTLLMQAANNALAKGC
jgi:hypothetical protein